MGTHAYGDRAVRVLLGVYERGLERNPSLSADTLVMECGALVGPERRAQALRVGVPVTIQQPQLHDTAEVEGDFRGPSRSRARFPPATGPTWERITPRALYAALAAPETAENKAQMLHATGIDFVKKELAPGQ
ncbi:hypothetical protein [Streptomyces sp. BPTC-684]|uniref:hypothetical protein n=1 Tax=Streptomyces sp. BPTC-684 TaxID=3043734 RepID=UPI0024B0ABD3|nr:hypothetical protein [Streptomyces sp. BPTC-684]WHM40035.1 hypothetical protein QIY60_26385 [Streptomyces sp. BPTC-684]